MPRDVHSWCVSLMFFFTLHIQRNDQPPLSTPNTSPTAAHTQRPQARNLRFFADPGGETVSSPFARTASSAAPPPAEESQVLALRLSDASLTLTKPLGCRVVAQAVP